MSSAPIPPAKEKPQAREDRNLLARHILFSASDRAAPSVSPDGKKIAFLGADEGVPNLFSGALSSKFEAKALTRNRQRGILRFEWLGSSKHLVFLEDPSGRGTPQAYLIPAEGGEPTALTKEGAQAKILKTSTRQPEKVLLLSNSRDARFFDVLLVDVKHNKSTVVLENTLGFSDFVADEDLRVRLAMRPSEKGGVSLVEVKGKDPSAWPEVAFFGVSEAGSSRPLAVNGNKVLLLDNRDRSDTALVELDLSKKSGKVIAEAKGLDVASVLLDPRSNKPLAYATFGDRRSWSALDKGITQDLEIVSKASQGDMEIVSRSADDKVWLVAFQRPESPTRFFRYDRGTDRQVNLLFSSDRLLETKTLAGMKPISFPARDGLEISGYLTMPSAAAAGSPPPLVLWVHGGPWERDRWTLQPYHQLFSSRGYATLSVNYRGSRGFGKSFLNAGNREWGGKMQDDLSDAVAWVAKQGLVDAKRVAIGGENYGGYAALMGLASTPDLFSCAVDINGPSDLVAMIKEAPPLWTRIRGELSLRVGDPDNAESAALLGARSPVKLAGQIKAPLLVIEGANDPHATRSDALVREVARRGTPVTYAVFAEEGYAISNPFNRIAQAAVIDEFLARCFGGVYEPYGDALKKSTISPQTGVDHLPALREALGTR